MMNRICTVLCCIAAVSFTMAAQSEPSLVCVLSAKLRNCKIVFPAVSEAS